MAKPEIWYYLFDGSKTPGDLYYIRPEEPWEICEFVIIKEPYTSPEIIWVKLTRPDEPRPIEWFKVPGEYFHWWWEWFKAIKVKAIKEEKLTDIDLFERIGLELL